MSELAPSSASTNDTPDGRRQLAAYALLVLLPAAVTVGVLRLGRGLQTANASVANSAPPIVPAALAVLRPSLLLAQLVAIIVVSRLVGRLFVRYGQPRVVGEMIAGVLLGPSVLGMAMPVLYELLFPRGSVRFLNALSQVGLMLFMFLVGLELQPRAIRQQGRTVILAAHAGIAVPFCLGTATALLLYSRFAPGDVPFLGFALFVGVAMSVTAFPILARILSEQAWRNSPLASLALASAAVSDVTAWCVLALVVAVARAGATPLPMWVTVGGLVGLVIAMATGGRTLAGRVASRLTRTGESSGVNGDALAAIVVIVLLCALATEFLGVHALFGAFLAGVIMPKDESIVRALVDVGHLRARHCGGGRRQARGVGTRGAHVRLPMARRVVLRRTDEYERTDGIGGAEYRPGCRDHHTATLCRARHHGVADNTHDFASAAGHRRHRASRRCDVTVNWEKRRVDHRDPGMGEGCDLIDIAPAGAELQAHR